MSEAIVGDLVFIGASNGSFCSCDCDDDHCGRNNPDHCGCEDDGDDGCELDGYNIT